MSSEAYLDIVWRQFKKNRPAFAALCLMGPLFLTAIFAPAISSNIPFVFYEGDRTIYPWLRVLFVPDQISDYVFNMALLGFFPWVIIAALTNLFGKRRHVPGRRRLLWIVRCNSARPSRTPIRFSRNRVL